MTTGIHVERGDVVQISPDVGPVFGGMFAIVTAVESWGVKADVQQSRDSYSPVRLEHGQYAKIGKAEWARFLR